MMGVTDRGLRAWLPKPPSIRQRRDMVIPAHMREQYRLGPGSYGRPRMTGELNEPDLRVGQRRVGRVRRKNSPPDCFLTLLTARERHPGCSQPQIQAQDRQQSHLQYRAESAATGFHGKQAEPEVGGRHHLYLDAGRLGLSGGHHRPVFRACHWLGDRQPDEAGPGPEGADHRPAPPATGLYSSYRSRVAILACDYQKLLRQYGFMVSISGKGTAMIILWPEAFSKP